LIVIWQRHYFKLIYIPAIVVLISLLPGCDRPSTPTPTTPQTAASAPATHPTTYLAEPATIVIDDKEYDCPPARLVIGVRDDQIVARLDSDDPPAAADDSYTGNGFHLEMPLDITDATTLAGARWDFQATNADQIDEIDGIYLQGRRFVLQPLAVHVEFANASTPVKILMTGTFQKFDNDAENDKGQLVTVRAEMQADVRVESPEK
jgi:hypothetical protein